MELIQDLWYQNQKQIRQAIGIAIMVMCLVLFATCTNLYFLVFGSYCLINSSRNLQQI